MIIVKEDKIESDQIHQADTSAETQAKGNGDAKWYIFRYKVMTKHIKDYLEQNIGKVFFPFRKVRKVREDSGRVDYIEQPCTPGYVFIYASIDKAIVLGRKAGLFPWKKRLDTYQEPLPREQQYHSLTCKVMDEFKEVITYFQNDIKLFDPSEIDIEQDDLVEFVLGAMQGQRGYARVENSKSGGGFIAQMWQS